MRPSLLLAALLVPAAARPGGALRSQEPRAYSFDKRTQLGDSVAGGVLEFDIEPGTINTAGNIGFGADFKIKSGDVESGGEAIFISNREGGLRLITRFDVPAPGGWANAKGFWGPVMINAAGDLAFVFLLQGAPHDQFGGLFVYSKEADETVPLILPNKPAPGGGLFKGAGAHATINNKGMVACPALIEAGFSQSIPPFRDGLGVGIFRQDSSGALKSVVRPGDPAKPDGRTFDIAINPFLNDAGDMGFDAHRTDERCEPIGGAIFCTLGVYLLKVSGELIALAPLYSPAPGGGTFRNAFGSILNEKGEAAFLGDLSSEPLTLNSQMAVFLYTGGEVIPIARPGDPMPGGGKVKTGGAQVGCCHINNRSEVTFNATLDTRHEDNQKMTFPDQGLYLWKNGGIRLLARTGTGLEGLGTIELLIPPALKSSFPNVFPWPYAGTASNDLGQVIFSCTLFDGTSPLLAATPAAVSVHLGKATATANAYEVLVTSDEPASGFRFALSLEEAEPGQPDECAGARIVQVEAGADLPAGTANPQVTILAAGRQATVDAALPSGQPLAAGTYLRAATVLIEGGPSERGKCFLRFAALPGDPHSPPVIQTASGDRPAATGSCQVTVVAAPPGRNFRRGDADGNGSIELTDPINVLGYLFLGDPPPGCLDAADVDDSGEIDLTDAVFSLGSQFLGETPPSAPGPSTCGPDPTDDGLDCKTYACP